MSINSAAICRNQQRSFVFIGRGVEVRHVAYGNFRLDGAGGD